MGAGRSRVINREIVELDNEDGTYTEVDLDSDLIQRMREDYESGILDFNMSDDEFHDYVNNSGVQVSYGWGLDDDGDVNILDDDYPVRNGDLKYYMYTAIETANTIQSAFQESTGSKDKVLGRILFDSPSGNYELENGVKGFQERIPITSNERIKRGSFSFYREYYGSALTLDASIGSRLPKEQIEHFKKNGTFDTTKTNTIIPILRERSASLNGWFSSSGSYAKTTVTHEMGHAVYTSMKEVFGKRFSNNVFKEWHERTYSSPVSGYAQRNHQESFAECFSLYVTGGKSSSKMYSEFKDIMKDFGLTKMYGCVK